MKPKIITTVDEAKNLKFGEHYIIQPKGLNLQKPEEMLKFVDEIAKIEQAVSIDIITEKSKKTKKAK